MRSTTMKAWLRNTYNADRLKIKIPNCEYAKFSDILNHSTKFQIKLV